MSHTRMTTLLFLLLALSPFVIFDSDYALILWALVCWKACMKSKIVSCVKNSGKKTTPSLTSPF